MHWLVPCEGQMSMFRQEWFSLGLIPATVLGTLHCPDHRPARIIALRSCIARSTTRNVATILVTTQMPPFSHPQVWLPTTHLQMLFSQQLLLTAGFPLTDAQVSTNYTVLTAHAPDEVDWPKFAGLDTLVLLMAARNLQLIMQRLLDTGWLPGTPASIASAIDLPCLRNRMLSRHVSRGVGVLVRLCWFVIACHSQQPACESCSSVACARATPWLVCH